MRFESLDGFLRNVAMMVVGWDQLVSHFILRDGGFEFVGALIVEDVLLRFDVGCFKAIDQMLVRADHFAGCAICHRLD